MRLHVSIPPYLSTCVSTPNRHTIMPMNNTLGHSDFHLIYGMGKNVLNKLNIKGIETIEKIKLARIN